ncbi:hypothetical protein KRR38_07060 [Novosphingobium sp. G106]|uniref:hypothetical protein n=1 Tax=Novosphingobium sp. G106 TaxID=2849500 RepID=UPI001C2DAAF3|nr:hypothetical protein [Novosphingobium sp. G106]MBV1687441.1 hypothetical protein [Novosphingobium sp. G106]
MATRARHGAPRTLRPDLYRITSKQLVGAVRSGPRQQDLHCGQAVEVDRPSATIHRIYDPYNPPLNAIISVARRLQEVLLETGALDGRPLPFPELAPAWCHTANNN